MLCVLDHPSALLLCLPYGREKYTTFPHLYEQNEGAGHFSHTIAAQLTFGDHCSRVDASNVVVGVNDSKATHGQSRAGSEMLKVASETARESSECEDYTPPFLITFVFAHGTSSAEQVIYG